MYDSNDYDDYNRVERPLTDAELKAQKIAQKRAYKEHKKALRKQNGGGAGRFFATAGLAVLFGVLACFAYKGTSFLFDKYIAKPVVETKTNETAFAAANDDAGSIKVDSKLDERIKDEINDILADLKDKDYGDFDISASFCQNWSVVDVVEKAMPSIVAITNKSIQEIPSFYGLGIQRYESEGGGSGIIIGQTDTELLIATNAHVVSDADTLTVMFVDEEACEATIEGSDAINDIAIIAVSLSDIKGSTLDKIKPCEIGDSENLKIGEQVVAIGNALGYGQSVTTGIVSALNRPIANEGDGYIQTDAAINPGNSGGALLNMKGELIGINTAKLANMKVEGMGYAIPIASARPILDDMLTDRDKVDEMEAGFLGISGLSVSQDISSQYNIPIGVYVSEVEKGKAADRAGIQSGDVIVKVDGIGMDSMNKLKDRLLYYKAGEKIDVVVKRVVDGKYKDMTMTVTLDSRKGTALDPSSSNYKEEQAEEEPEKDVEKEKPEDKDTSDDKDAKDKNGQKSGQFNFGNSTFRYSIPSDLFDFFDFN